MRTIDLIALQLKCSSGDVRIALMRLLYEHEDTCTGPNFTMVVTAEKIMEVLLRHGDIKTKPSSTQMKKRFHVL